MERIIAVIVICLCIYNSTYAQTRKHYEYRPAPQLGEVTCLAGIAILALASTSVITTDQAINKTVSNIGGALIFAGVVIDISTKDKHKKHKHWLRLKRR